MDLHVDGTGITSVPNLSNLEFLFRVNLDQNAISDLSGLTDAALSWLDLDHNMIRDITPLGTAKNLKFLDVADNFIEDVAPLGQLTQLEILDADENVIEDAEPLVTLRNLQSLDLHGNRLREYRFVEAFDLMMSADLRDNLISIGFGSIRACVAARARKHQCSSFFSIPRGIHGFRFGLIGERGSILLTVPPLKKPWNFRLEQSRDLTDWSTHPEGFLSPQGFSRFELPLDSAGENYFRISPN